MANENIEKINEKKKEEAKKAGKLTLDFEDDVNVIPLKKPNLIKTKPGEKTGQVNLYDCLACSGCVTSSEVVLMEVIIHKN